MTGLVRHWDGSDWPLLTFVGATSIIISIQSDFLSSRHSDTPPSANSLLSSHSSSSSLSAQPLLAGHVDPEEEGPAQGSYPLRVAATTCDASNPLGTSPCDDRASQLCSNCYHNVS